MISLFDLIGISIVVCSALVVLSYNQVHALFFLISVFVQIMLLLLVSFDIEFVSFLLVIVYIGAIAILFLFVVMMLDVNVPSTAMNSQSFGILLFSFFTLVVIYWLGFSIDLGGPEWLGNRFITIDFDKTSFYNGAVKFKKLLVDQSGIDHLVSINTHEAHIPRKEQIVFSIEPDAVDEFFYNDLYNFFVGNTSLRDQDNFVNKNMYILNKMFKTVDDEFILVISSNPAYANVLWTDVLKFITRYADLYLCLVSISSYFINSFSNVGNIFDTFLFTTWEDFVNFDSDLHTISFVLYTYYYVPFFISSFILLVAMIGAISLTLKQKLYVKRQQAVLQNHRNFEKTVRKVR